LYAKKCQVVFLKILSSSCSNKRLIVDLLIHQLFGNGNLTEKAGDSAITRTYIPSPFTNTDEALTLVIESAA